MNIKKLDQVKKIIPLVRIIEGTDLKYNTIFTKLCNRSELRVDEAGKIQTSINRLIYKIKDICNEEEQDEKRT